MEYLTVLKIIRDEIMSHFTGFDVRIAYDEGDVNKTFIVPRIILNSALDETEEVNELKIKATLMANSKYDFLSDEAMEIFTFISDYVKSYFPAVIRVSLSSVEAADFGKFKKRVLEINAIPSKSETTSINGKVCNIASLKIIKESDKRGVWQMCDETPVAYIAEKYRCVGIIKNCTLSKEILDGEFEIKYSDKLLKGCTLIYAKGEEYIQEAKFYIGSIE